MDTIPTSSANNSEMPSVSSPLLSSNLSSNQMPSVSEMPSVETTHVAMHEVNNDGGYLLNNYLRILSAPKIQDVSALADPTFTTAEPPHQPQTEGAPKSASHINGPTFASVNFGSLGSPQMMHRNSSDSLLSSATSEDSFELDFDAQQKQHNLYLSYAAAAVAASNGLLQSSILSHLPIFPNTSNPSAATMMFDQNSFCSPHLFGQQISVGEALGLHNAAVSRMLAANENGQNGKSGNEKPIDGRKNRRNRIAFSKFQLDELEKCFQSTPYPDVTTRDAVSKFIQLPEEKVQVWLKNRRAKQRRILRNLQLENGSTSSSIRSRFGESRQNQKETPGKMWNPATIASFDGLLTPTFPTSVSSPAVFDVKNLFSARCLQRSILENFMITSQLASFSV